MRNLTIVAFFVLIHTQSDAQIRDLDFSFHVYQIPQETFAALGKYLDKGGRDAERAYSKLVTLPDVKELHALEGKGRSGNRGKAFKEGFEVEYDPVVNVQGTLVDLNYAVTLPTADAETFTGQVTVPAAQPFLINSWANQNEVIALFLKATVRGVRASGERANLDMLKCDLTVLRLASTADAETVSKLDGKLATEEASKEGRTVYQQLSLARSGQRSRGRKGVRDLEVDAYLGAGKKEAALRLMYNDSGDRYSGTKSMSVGTSTLIPLTKNGEPSPLVVVVQTTYLGFLSNQAVPENQLPKFAAPDEMVTQTYVIPPDLFLNLHEKLDDSVRFGDTKKILSEHGISFGEGAMALHNAGAAKMIFRNVESEHRKLLDLIQGN